MATPLQFEFKLPVSGELVKWRPLKVGEQIDLTAAYNGAQQVYRAPAMYAARITAMGAKQGTSPVSLSDIKDWDEVDYMAFSDEVDGKEAERQRALMKRAPVAVANQTLQAAIIAARETALAALKALDDAYQAAQAAMLAGERDRPLS